MRAGTKIQRSASIVHAHTHSILLLLLREVLLFLIYRYESEDSEVKQFC